MGSDFKTLCQITADMIDTNRITNPNLGSLLNRLIIQDGTFIFFSSKKGHRDHSEKIHHTDVGVGEYGSVHRDYKWGERTHSDWTDHNDYTEATHTERYYSEAHYHTETGGGHLDHSERSHIDS